MNQSVTPYLTVKGAAEAIAFYQKAFGAKEEMRMPAQDGKRLMHAHLSINGGALFLSDEFPEHGDVTAPKNGQSPVAVALAFAKPADVDATYKRAVAAGAKGTLEPGDQFWGARFAMLTDPFGHRWMLDAPLGKK
jgi:PhnB protein